MANQQILEAIESFACELNGVRQVIAAGVDRVAASHPLALAYPTRFRPVEDGLTFRDDATATADPGESRIPTTAKSRGSAPADRSSSGASAPAGSSGDAKTKE